MMTGSISELQRLMEQPTQCAPNAIMHLETFRDLCTAGGNDKAAIVAQHLLETGEQRLVSIENGGWCLLDD